MSAGPTAALFTPGSGHLHRLPAHCKVVALVLFVLAVVATPRTAFWAFGAYGIALVALAVASGIGLRRWLARLLIEVPFLAFAVALPIVGHGPTIERWGLTLSVDGLWAAWNIVAKGTLGVGAAVLVASTTTMADLVVGLERLRLPRVFTTITGFMVRYLDLTAGEISRMTMARAARGERPRWLWQARATAASAGTVFVRSFERGERVHLAMLSRGFDGSFPASGSAPASRSQWATALLLPGAAALVAATALVDVG